MAPKPKPTDDEVTPVDRPIRPLATVCVVCWLLSSEPVCHVDGNKR